MSDFYIIIIYGDFYQIDTFFNLNIFNLYIFLHIIITQEIIVKVFGHVVVHQV